MKSINEKNQVFGIVEKLLKYIFLNIFTKESYEILDLILNGSDHNNLTQISNLLISNIIEQIYSFC